MTNPDRSLSDTEKPAVQQPSLATAAVETVLDLDEVMSQARLVERTARICMRGDLQGEFDDLVEELGGLVDADGNVLATGDDTALSEQSRAHEISSRLAELQAEMTAATRTIRFRALPEDEWRPFDRSHRNPDGSIKDADVYNDELIARTAIAPTLTRDQVTQLRSKLGPTQIAALANAAFLACASGGVDVPKSPHFLPAPRPTSSGRS